MSENLIFRKITEIVNLKNERIIVIWINLFFVLKQNHEFWRENSNYSGNSCVKKILGYHCFLAQKFKFTIFSFSKNRISGDNLRFSNSVLRLKIDD